VLRDYFPAFIEAFQDRSSGVLAHPDARLVLAIAPTPTHAARLRRPQLVAALKRAGRQSGIHAACVRLQAIFRRTWLHQAPLAEQAMGQQALALLMQLNAAAGAEDELAEATRLAFQQHPDATILTSFPVLGELAAARVLAEISDDRAQFADAHGLTAPAGAHWWRGVSQRRSRSTHCGQPVVLDRPVENDEFLPLARVAAATRDRHHWWDSLPVRRIPGP
jgi:transposase